MTLSKAKGGLEINLVGGMAVTPGSNSGIQEFLVYATNSYGTSGKQRFDCVQVKLGEDTDADDHNTHSLYDLDANKPLCQVPLLCNLMFLYLTCMCY